MMVSEHNPTRVSIENGNSYTAAGVVDTTSRPGWILIDGLDPIRVADKILFQAVGEDEFAPVKQFLQRYNIMKAGNVAALDKLQISIGNTNRRREGAQYQLAQYGYTVPAVPTGVQSTDKYNAFYSIAGKVNSDTSNAASALAALLITHAAIGTAAFVIGDTILGQTSGGTFTLKQGNIKLTAAGKWVLVPINGVMPIIGETLDNTLSSGTGTAVISASGIDAVLEITDTGTYNNAKGTQQGQNEVLGTIGFASTDVVNATYMFTAAGALTGTMDVDATITQAVTLAELTVATGSLLTGGGAGSRVYAYLNPGSTAPSAITNAFLENNTAGKGFTPASLTIGAVIQVNQGTRMIEDVPVIELTSSNLAKGLSWFYPYGQGAVPGSPNMPVAGSQYQSFLILSTNIENNSAIGDNASTGTKCQIIYLDIAGTNYAFTKSALEAI